MSPFDITVLADAQGFAHPDRSPVSQMMRVFRVQGTREGGLCWLIG
ncbi:hypothetical protein [Thalassospira marina]|nr:hypothetical protein [Thalassospira marina]